MSHIKAIVLLHLACEACQAASLSCITFNRSSLAAAAAALSASLLALQVSRCRVAENVPVKALKILAVCKTAQVRWNGILHSAHSVEASSHKLATCAAVLGQQHYLMRLLEPDCTALRSRQRLKRV